MEGFEEDPAAAFLAREQDELADIAEDTLGFTPNVTTTVGCCVHLGNCFMFTSFRAQLVINHQLLISLEEMRH